MLGRILEWFGYPGLVAPGEYRGARDGQTLSVRTSRYYTILHVDGTEYYFLRRSGRFDGIGALTVGAEWAASRYRAACTHR